MDEKSTRRMKIIEGGKEEGEYKGKRKPRTEGRNKGKESRTERWCLVVSLRGETQGKVLFGFSRGPINTSISSRHLDFRSTET